MGIYTARRYDRALNTIHNLSIAKRAKYFKVFDVSLK